MVVGFLVALILLLPLQQGLNEPEDQSSPYVVRHFTTEQGLPANYIVQFVQDEKGYLYAATFDGLVIFDGYHFRVVNTINTPNLPSNRIAGIRYINGFGALLHHENSQISLYRHSDVKVLESPSVANIGFHDTTPDGTLWFTTSDGFARLTEDNKVELVEFRSDRNNPLHVEPYSKGSFFVLDKTGLYREEKTGTPKLLLSADRFPFPVESTMRIFRVDDFIWVTGTNGFFAFRDGKVEMSDSFERSELPYLWDYRKIDQRRLIFFFENGFYEADLEADTLEKYRFGIDTDVTMTDGIFQTPSGDLVLIGDDEVIVNGEIIFESKAIKNGFVDREGTIWVSVIGDGIYQLKKKFVQNITRLGTSNVKNVYPIIQDKTGSIWLGTFDDGIFRFTSSGTVTNWSMGTSTLPTGVVRSLYEHSSGDIYAGLWDHGLWRWNGQQWSRIPEYNSMFDGTAQIEAMYESRNGRFFIGTTSRLVVEEQGKYVHFTDRDGTQLTGVRAIREDSSGTLFFATEDDGVAILDGDNQLSFIDQADGLSSNVIRDIYIYSSDTLFVGSEDRGLNREVLDADKSASEITNINTSDGLLSNSLHKIIRDSYGKFWISSNRGIMAISISRLNRYLDRETELLPIRRFTETQGMINSEANGGVQSAGLVTSDGEIWFPNQSGVTVLNSSEVAGAEDLQPNPIIEQITVDDSVITVFDREKLMLPKGKRNIRVRYSAPSLASSESIRFRYKLEGMMQDWQPGNALNSADITNLDEGTHRFVVQSYSPAGRLTETSVMLTVPPYFYETGWFYSLLGLLVVILIYTGYNYRVRMLQKRQQVLQRRVDEQTKELKKAAEQKSRFFTGITHELKTPLSLILGPVEELLDNQTEQSKSLNGKYLRMVQRNGYRLENLINQILGVSKMNADAIQLTLQPANITELTLQVAGQFHSLLDQKNIRLETTINEVTEEPVYVDREAWERVIINLISNAIKFSPESERIILSVSDEEERVRISIRDFGPGISSKDQERVFEYLYQSEGTDSAGGTVIGLYMVKGLVERMGGSITLNSEEGQGSEFIVRLKKGYNHFDDRDEVIHEPLDPEQTPDEINIPRQKPIEDTELPSDAEHILLVEDNRDFRKYIVSVLTEDYRTSTASDGREALDKMEEVTPDLIISDVMMPGMDGLDFVNRVRNIEKFKHLPVIFLSAKDQEVDREAGLSTGADIYLTKPIRSRTLCSQIAAVLRREKILKEKDTKKEDSEEPDFRSEVREIIYRQLGDPNLTVEKIADALFMSRSKLYRSWKKVSDKTLNEMIKKMRLDEARILIRDKKFTVKEAAQAVGYSDPNYLSTSFKEEFDESPSELLK